MSELISIIIPLYNRRDLIRETIQSVVAQTYKNWEIIVIDDGSTDSSFESVELMAQTESRIKIYRRSREPKGAPTCRNIGISLAQGEFIMFLDSDDMLAPYCLKQRLASLQAYPDVDFTVFSTLLFHHTPGDSNVLLNVATDEEDLVRFLRLDPVWCIMGPIYRRSVFSKIGGFNEHFSSMQDYELHVRSLYTGLHYKKMLHLTPDNFYRQHAFDSISQKNQTKESSLLMHMEVISSMADGLRQHQPDEKRCFEALASFFFLTAKQWIRHHNRLKKSWQVWSTCYENGCIGWWHFTMGNLYLIALATILNRKDDFPRLAYYINKFFRRVLPSGYLKLKTSLYQGRYRTALTGNLFHE